MTVMGANHDGVGSMGCENKDGVGSDKDGVGSDISDFFFNHFDKKYDY